MPENTVSVARPSKWGNPLKLIGDQIFIDARHRRKVLDRWVFLRHGDIRDIMFLYWHLISDTKFIGQDLQYWSDHFSDLDFGELSGKDLACFCPLDSPCHADLLIERANYEKRKG